MCLFLCWLTELLASQSPRRGTKTSIDSAESAALLFLFKTAHVNAGCRAALKRRTIFVGASLPADLLRHEVLMISKPVPNAVIAEFVDDIFLPLVRPKTAREKKTSRDDNESGKSKHPRFGPHRVANRQCTRRTAD
jgi:hypothetical protein